MSPAPCVVATTAVCPLARLIAFAAVPVPIEPVPVVSVTLVPVSVLVPVRVIDQIGRASCREREYVWAGAAAVDDNTAGRVPGPARAVTAILKHGPLVVDC